MLIKAGKKTGQQTTLAYLINLFPVTFKEQVDEPKVNLADFANGPVYCTTAELGKALKLQKEGEDQPFEKYFEDEKSVIEFLTDWYDAGDLETLHTLIERHLRKRPDLKVLRDASTSEDYVDNEGEWSSSKQPSHFFQYRCEDKYDDYHSAAKQVHAGSAEDADLALFNGLQEEVLSSNIILSKGQVLFHGRRDIDLLAEPYPAFTSTTLSFKIAHQRARTRADEGEGHVRGDALYIFVLKLQNDIPALWGEKKYEEWELLLPAQCHFKNAKWTSGKFIEVYPHATEDTREREIIVIEADVYAP
ncbi:hypothetical protein ACQU0X_28790 [Pseudovibrio ascidiaceicola]|uniref:hypothetical protein n=1 Tax=Pseudovibrio ascidiaceicola TaxID=285279 RepID=UPI003D35D845